VYGQRGNGKAGWAKSEEKKEHLGSKKKKENGGIVHGAFPEGKKRGGHIHGL